MARALPGERITAADTLRDLISESEKLVAAPDGDRAARSDGPARSDSRCLE